MAKETAVVKGDKVHVVLASGKLAVAEVVTARKNETLDLEFEHNGGTVRIDSSPLDPTGTRPDSWRPIPAAAPKA